MCPVSLWKILNDQPWHNNLWVSNQCVRLDGHVDVRLHPPRTTRNGMQLPSSLYFRGFRLFCFHVYRLVIWVNTLPLSQQYFITIILAQAPLVNQKYFVYFRTKNTWRLSVFCVLKRKCMGGGTPLLHPPPRRVLWVPPLKFLDVTLSGVLRRLVPVLTKGVLPALWWNQNFQQLESNTTCWWWSMTDYK